MEESKEHDFHIIVNAREKTVERNVLSFNEVVLLAPNLPPPGPLVDYKVSYRHAVQPKDGTLIDGETVMIRNGSEFVVSATNRS